MVTPRRVLEVLAACVAVLLTSPVMVPAAVAAKAPPPPASVNEYRQPSRTPQGVLNVFLPGTKLTPGQSRAYEDASASFGFHTIGLAYENEKNVNKICFDSKDVNCNGKVRREIVFGDDVSRLVRVSKHMSVVGRLNSALADRVQNDPSGNWEQFQASNGEPDWSKIIVSGHSQGAGHAAILGIDRPVRRVAMMGGPNDKSRVSKSAPEWEKPGMTPAAQWYGLASAWDTSKPRQVKAWSAFGMDSAVDQQDVPTGTHRMITTLGAANDEDHLSLVVDRWLVGGAADPRLKNSWKALLGG